MPAPAHVRVADDLRREIYAGTWAPGDQLPSQADLAATHGVGLMVIRSALGLLQAEGILASVPRRGVIVAHPPVVAVLTDLDAEWPHERAAAALAAVRATPDLARRLAVRPGDPVLAERVELLDADGRPSHLRTRWTVTGRPEPTTAAAPTVGARGANAAEADLLAIRHGATVIVVRRAGLDDAGAPVDLVELVLPADRWEVAL